MSYSIHAHSLPSGGCEKSKTGLQIEYLSNRLVRFYPQHVDLALQAYLLLSICQLVTHERHQFGERWAIVGIQVPTLAHDPVSVKKNKKRQTEWR